MNAWQIQNVVDRAYEDIRASVTNELTRMRPGEKITIFISAKLYSYFEDKHMRNLQTYLDPHADMRMTLFGCNVEIYADDYLSFYVTTAKKIVF